MRAWTIMDVFFDNLPSKKEFKKILDKILINIENKDLILMQTIHIKIVTI